MKLSRVERLLKEDRTFMACVDAPADTEYQQDLPHGLIEVTPRSVLPYRRTVEAFAWMFKREFQYDSVQYQARENSDARTAAFLWERRGHPEMLCGAAVFRWMQWSDIPHGYTLAWVWLHPHNRREGLLTAAWPYFKERFGDFHVERPLSAAMSAFLLKATVSV